jgi:hypothetical protein
MRQQDKRPYHNDADDDNDKLAFLRGLMDDSVALEKAYYEIHRQHFEGRAAASTVEALMLGLRARGLGALKEAPARRRLAELSEPQLHEVCERLQKLKPEIARAWTADEVRRLLEAWMAQNGR